MKRIIIFFFFVLSTSLPFISLTASIRTSTLKPLDKSCKKFLKHYDKYIKYKQENNVITVYVIQNKLVDTKEETDEYVNVKD